MEEIKGLFGTEALTYEQFSEKLAGAGTDKINLVNLAKGGYVDSNKHQREVEAAKGIAITSSKEYGDIVADRDNFKNKYETLVAENIKKENQTKVQAKVQPDFVDFIYDKVCKEMANDDKATFDTALDKVLKDSPQYGISKSKPVVRIGSGLKMDGNDNKDGKTANSSMNSAILQAAGRTPKN